MVAGGDGLCFNSITRESFPILWLYPIKPVRRRRRDHSIVVSVFRDIGYELSLVCFRHYSFLPRKDQSNLFLRVSSRRDDALAPEIPKRKNRAVPNRVEPSPARKTIDLIPLQRTKVLHLGMQNLNSDILALRFPMERESLAHCNRCSPQNHCRDSASHQDFPEDLISLVFFAHILAHVSHTFPHQNSNSRSLPYEHRNVAPKHG